MSQVSQQMALASSCILHTVVVRLAVNVSPLSRPDRSGAGRKAASRAVRTASSEGSCAAGVRTAVQMRRCCEGGQPVGVNDTRSVVPHQVREEADHVPGLDESDPPIGPPTGNGRAARIRPPCR
jgi:hypothetical protein